jgi:paraquat-inducible protein B
MNTVWVIPIVAALIGGWLWWSALQEQGPVIQVSFLTADGLEAGKTKIKYKDVEVGTVTSIDFARGEDRILATCEMMAGTEPYMVDGTRFWVVKPRIGAGGISGLGTIVSGAYMNMDITDQGTPTTQFTGLELPPARPLDAKGLRIKLRAPTLGSLDIGTTVSHVEIAVGDVEGYRLNRETDSLEFDIYVEEEYMDLVRENSRFWNVSGLSASLSAEGFKLHASSLDAIITGGVAFGMPHGEPPGPPATNDMVFDLYKSQEDAAAITGDAAETLIFFQEPLKGLTVGASVDFQGIVIGKVLELGVEYDPETLAFTKRVLVETYRGRLAIKGQIDDNEPHEERIAKLVDRGLRAQLSSPNLLTGARSIELVFRPGSQPVLTGPPDSPYPELPSILSTSEEITETLDSIPLIVADLKTTMEAVAAMATSDDVKNTLSSVAAASGSLEGLLGGLEQDREPLVGSLNDAVAQVDTLVSNLDEVVKELRDRAPGLLDSVEATALSAQEAMEGGEQTLAGLNAGLPTLQHRLDQALAELASGLKAIRGLAEYLERHPEALLKGKDGGP